MVTHSIFLKSSEILRDSFDRELLAIYLVIKHFHYFIEGRSFHIPTDHKPLVYALDTRPDRYSPCQARHLDLISQFTSNIHHVKGIHNPVADALSTVEVGTVSGRGESPPVIDFKAMALAQDSDPKLKHHQTGSSLKLQAVPL